MNSEISYCYRCGCPATSKEHVPAKAFFPKGLQQNLVTVSSCVRHNQNTSSDDEYVRNVIITCDQNNRLAYEIWKGKVKRSFIRSPKLFFRQFKVKHKDGSSYLYDRLRIDNVMKKIAFGLYFHKYRSIWKSEPVPFYLHIYFDDYKSDIEIRWPSFNQVPWTDSYEGANPNVFRYEFFDANINGIDDRFLKITFYEGFTVLFAPNAE
jgi:hypothetical protein